MCFCQGNFRGSEMPFKMLLLRLQNWSRLKPNYYSTITAIKAGAITFYRDLAAIFCLLSTPKMHLAEAHCAHQKHCYPETPLGSHPTSRVSQMILQEKPWQNPSIFVQHKSPTHSCARAEIANDIEMFLRNRGRRGRNF